MRRRLAKYVCFGLAATALLYLIFSEYRQIRSWDNVNFEAAARNKLQEAAASFDELLAETDTLFEIIETHFSQNLSSQDLVKSLQAKEGHFFLSGIYVVPSGNGSVLFIANDNSGFKRMENIRVRPKWLQEAVAKDDTLWGGPIFVAAGRRQLYCCIPFQTADKSHASIVFLYDAQKVSKRLLESGLNRFGLPYIMDRTSHFIVHPLDETRSLLELGQENNDDALIKLSNDIINHSPLDSKYRHINTVTKKICDEIAYPANKTGWLMALSVYDGVPLETAEYQTLMRENLLQMIVYCTVLLLLICKLCSENKLFGAVYSVFIAYPVILLIMIMCIVIAYNRFPQQSKAVVDSAVTDKWDPKRIIDRQSLNDFVDDYQQESLALYNEPARIIPSGIYIYSVEFMDSHTIKVTGTFWQKFLQTDIRYPESMVDTYHYADYDNKGLFFPGGHVSEIEQTDSIEIVMDNYPAVLFRWNFDIEIEQQLSYSLYPFGKNELSLLLWSTDLDDNTVLIPDLEGYKQLYPTDKPGLDNNFHIKGWDISGSYYSYKMESYLCNFGNTSMFGINEFPELVYKISISRKFIDILICKIVPLLVVLVLLFTILFVRVKSDGFNNIIGCSGLFFVLVLDHINLRESVLSEQIMYLEYCYFLSYILLLLITITSFDISKNGCSYNMWVDTVLKKYFWTIIFGSMAIITATFFY